MTSLVALLLEHVRGQPISGEAADKTDGPDSCTRSQAQTYLSYGFDDGKPTSASKRLAANVAVAERLLDFTVQAQDTLADAGIRSALLEGLSCVSSGTLPSELFLGSDADLLVHEQSFEATIQILLQDLGGNLRFRSGAKIAAISLHNPEDNQRPVEIELRSHPLPRLNRFVLPVPVQTTDLLERSVVSCGGAVVLSRVDQFLQAAGHAYLHAFHRPPGLRVLVDLAASAELSPAEWRLVGDRAERYSMLQIVRIAIALLESMTGCDLANIDELRPRFHDLLIASSVQRHIDVAGRSAFWPVTAVVEVVVGSRLLIGLRSSYPSKPLDST